jgi:HPt (histidine-containing phosphotransfer) domain-containing protein
MTASAMKQDQEQCLEAGMDSYVSKPVHAEELYKAVEGIVRQGTSAPAPQPAEPRPMPPANPAEVMDWNAALKRMRGMEDRVAPLAKLFMSECPKTLSEIRTALAGGDAKRLQRAAHTLKGSADIFAAQRVVKCALQLEESARQGKLDHAGEMCAVLETEVACLLEALTQAVDASGTARR